MRALFFVIIGTLLAVMVMYGVTPTQQQEHYTTATVVAETQEEQEYYTEREKYLYTQVEHTVSLPGFENGGYHELLASYAYNTCKRVIQGSGYYSCENLVKTWNAENGGRNKDVKSGMNRNGTRDHGICQLNDQRHRPFIESKWFSNPLAQMDYCLNVRQDAQKKKSMPWYAYHVRHQRDRGIVFLGQSSERQQVNNSKNYYLEAVKRQEEYQQAKQKANNAWKACKNRGQCVE